MCNYLLLVDKFPSSPPSDSYLSNGNSPVFTRQASATFSSSHTVSRTTGSQIKSFLSSSPELFIIPPLPLPNPASLSAPLTSPSLPSSPKGSPRFTTYFLDLKSRQIAEQMTLLEEELMFRVQRPEFLYFGKEKVSYFVSGGPCKSYLHSCSKGEVCSESFQLGGKVQSSE